MKHIYTILLCIIIALLPWGRSINGFGIVLLSLVWLLSMDWKAKWYNIKEYKWVILPLLLYFVSLLVGLIYTPNVEAGLDEIVKKLSFLLIPIIIVSIFDKIEGHTDLFKKVLIGSLLLNFVIALIYAYVNYQKGNTLAFFYIHLLGFTKMHPSYLSLYLILAICFLYELAQKESKYYFILIPIFIVFTLLLVARTEIFILFIVLLIISLHHFNKTKNLSILILSVSVLISCSLIAIKNIPELNTRFSVLVKGEENNHTFTGVKNERSKIWAISYDQIKKTPFWGIGTGSSASFFNKRFIELNYKLFLDKKINNAHNQFIQQLLIVGIPGLIILLFLYSFIFFKSLQYKYLYLFIFSITLIIASLTECIFETQSGIVFISIFYTLISLFAIKESNFSYSI
ncbi:MAG: O-antigen ligase family protein [Bacteroidota bacterium]